MTEKSCITCHHSGECDNPDDITFCENWKQEQWTACEECAHACGGGDDYLDCGLDLGSPFGGGVTFICDSFKQAPPQPACPECKGLGYIGDAATTALGNGAVVVADGEQCRACEGTGCVPSHKSATEGESS